MLPTLVIKSKNELISCCGEEIQDKILSEVHPAGEYAICFYESTDISHQSKLILIIHYMTEKGVKESFMNSSMFMEKLLMQKS